MSWVRLDDGFADHPKLLAAGPLGVCLQVRALCYCARHLTNGFVPHAMLPSLTAGFPARVGGWARVMVKAGLWLVQSGGYLIHDFLRYNPSRRRVLKKRKDTKRRQDAFRKRHAIRNALQTVSPSPTPETKKKKPKALSFSGVETADRARGDAPAVVEPQAVAEHGPRFGDVTQLVANLAASKTAPSP